ncbi:MAG: hypothetical protein DRO65_03695 [Candidatus Altiarchaeales archaeon]|nr:MAG: hypothetical protein DRO65_03695 [Candidatus Altiarchaeales archaeon]
MKIHGGVMIALNTSDARPFTVDVFGYLLAFSVLEEFQAYFEAVDAVLCFVMKGQRFFRMRNDLAGNINTLVCSSMFF